MNKKLYGRELAEKIASYLGKYISLANSHRDYCGVGFCLDKDLFYYTHFQDGYPDNYEEYTGSPYGWIKKFSDRESFIEWLSEQSDQSLSGSESSDPWYVKNQRITQKMLLEFLKLEEK
ncbi:MAG: hypothetical protein ACI86H_000723 [bacterium]|jgi:hypothetical protein